MKNNAYSKPVRIIALGLGSVWAVTALVFASYSVTQADTTTNSSGNAVSTVEPAISTITATSTANGTGVTVTWATDENATSRIAYGTSTPYSMYSPTDSNMVANHSVALSGLSPYTTYHYQIISTDTSGNTTSSSDQTFGTNYNGTGTSSAPILSSIATTNSADGTGTTITWTTDQPSTSQVSYGSSSTSYTNSTAADPNLVTNHSVTISGLTPQTTYYFEALSNNSSGAIGSVTGQSFTTGTTTSTNVSTSSPATTTPSGITLSATASSSNQTAGSPVSIAVAASNSGTSTGQGIVDVEVYDPSGNKAYQQAFAQDFSTTSIQNYTATFTPAAAGTYVVKLGAFNSDWTQNYLWNNSALTLQVTSSTSTASVSPVSPAPTTANSGYPGITLTPSSQTVSAGEHVDFNGRNFPHEEDINVYQNGVLAGKAHADGGGNFTTGSMTMPGTSGTYAYTFVGATTGVSMSSTIIVQ